MSPFEETRVSRADLDLSDSDDEFTFLAAAASQASVVANIVQTTPPEEMTVSLVDGIISDSDDEVRCAAAAAAQATVVANIARKLAAGLKKDRWVEESISESAILYCHWE